MRTLVCLCLSVGLLAGLGPPAMASAAPTPKWLESGVISAASDPDPSVRFWALEFALQAYERYSASPAEIAQLSSTVTAALDSDTESGVETGLGWIEKTHAATAEQVERLNKLIARGDLSVAVRACELLSLLNQFTNEKQGQRLEELLRGTTFPSVALVRRAGVLFRAHGASTAVVEEKLRSIFVDSRTLVADGIAAVSALGQLRAPQDDELSYVREALRRESFSFATIAARALKELHALNPEDVRSLRRFTRGTMAGESFMQIGLLKELQPEVDPLIAELAQPLHQPVRTDSELVNWGTTVQTLGNFSLLTDADVAALRPALSSPMLLVRCIAGMGILSAKAVTPADAAQLKILSRSSDHRCVGVGAQGAKQAKVDAGPFRAPLLKLLASKDDDAIVNVGFQLIDLKLFDREAMRVVMSRLADPTASAGELRALLGIVTQAARSSVPPPPGFRAVVGQLLRVHNTDQDMAIQGVVALLASHQLTQAEADMATAFASKSNHGSDILAKLAFILESSGSEATPYFASALAVRILQRDAVMRFAAGVDETNERIRSALITTGPQQYPTIVALLSQAAQQTRSRAEIVALADVVAGTTEDAHVLISLVDEALGGVVNPVQPSSKDTERKLAVLIHALRDSDASERTLQQILAGEAIHVFRAGKISLWGLFARRAELASVFHQKNLLDEERTLNEGTLKVLLDKVKSPWLIAIPLGVAIALVLCALWGALLWLHPLMIQKLTAVLGKKPVNISVLKFSLSVSLASLLLVRSFQRHPRVLDAWINRNRRRAWNTFRSATTVRDRTAFVPPPVRLQGKPVSAFSREDLSALLMPRSEIQVLSIEGEGGTGKTSLACQVGLWAFRYEGQVARPQRRLKLVVFIDNAQELSAVVGKASVTTIVLQKLSRAVGFDVSESLFEDLVKSGRLVVIVDGLSEMSDYSAAFFEDGLTQLAPSLAVLTSRTTAASGATRKVTLVPCLIEGAALAVFLESYIGVLGRGARVSPVQLYRWCEDLLRLSGQRPLPALFVTLYGQYVLDTHGVGEERGAVEVPKDLPDLILHYVRRLNARITVERIAHVVLEQDLKVIARLSVTGGSMQVSNGAPLHEVLQALGGDDPGRRIEYLMMRLKLVEQPHQSVVRIRLDPLTEYFSAMADVERLGKDEAGWKQTLAGYAQGDGLNRAARRYLEVLVDCVRSVYIGATVPAWVGPALQELLMGMGRREGSPASGSSGDVVAVKGPSPGPDVVGVALKAAPEGNRGS